MLELVSISVLGACLTALICMITDGTPYELPKLISFEKGFLRPRIVRSINWPKWKIASFQKDEVRRKNFYRSRRRSNKLSPEDRKNHGRHVQTSFTYLEPFAETSVPKTTNSIEEYLEEGREDVFLRGSPEGTANSRKYRERADATSPKSVDSKYTSSIAESLTRLKVKLRNRKPGDERLYGGSKVRTKKRRFVLPKSFVIGRKPEGDVVAERQDDSVDPIDERLRSPTRYCYLEALRIKTS